MLFSDSLDSFESILIFNDAMVKSHHQLPSPFVSPEAVINQIRRMASLVELTVATLALHTPVPELLAYIKYLPTFIRHILFQKLSNFRLREVEMAWEAAAKVEVQKPRDGFDPLAGDKFSFDRETQREWEVRLDQRYCFWRLFYRSLNMDGRLPNCRHVFWEEEFKSMLKWRTQELIGHVDELMEYQKLFVDVVRELRLVGGFICKDNAEILLALRYLQSLEVEYPYQQNVCWETMKRLVKENPHLTELKFSHGSLSDSDIAHLYTTLAKPTPAVENRLDTCRITVLEFVTVEIQPEGYRILVALVGEMPELLQLKVKSCIDNFDKKLLINATLCLPALERFFLVDDWLENDAFDGLKEIQKPLALRHLHLDNNDVSVKTIEAICQASMDGVLNLERLELSHNKKIRVPEIQALIPMLASPVAGSASVLNHLDLSRCNFGLEGVTSLLLALGHNKTLTHLNVGFNDFNVGFGDVLGDFLLTNSSVTHLKVDFVNLEQAGVSARLLTALESNRNLTSLSLVGNQLRSGGACAILGALVKRAQVKPFGFIDLSENEIELNGLKMIADIFEGFINADADSIRTAHSINGRESRMRQRVDSSDKDQSLSFSQCDNIILIERLRLVYNNFGWCRRDCITQIMSIQRHVGHLEC